MTSSTISGSVVVYESLSTSLNEALKGQLVHLYKAMSKADGQLDITVILQQKQNGAWDCGPFAIANAVALACGIDLCRVVWQQKAMGRFSTVFPHLPNFQHLEKKTYTISIYCACLKHIAGAEMLKHWNCKNQYHHPPCINLTQQQAWALVTEEPFVCHRCDPE